MKKALGIIHIVINIPAFFFALVGYLSKKEPISGDITRWRSLGKTSFKNDFIALLELLNNYREFRNIFYLRSSFLRHLKFFCPPYLRYILTQRILVKVCLFSMASRPLYQLSVSERIVG